MEYLIYLTNDCNLNCRYCSVLVDCERNHIPIRPSYTNEELLSFIKDNQSKLAQNNVDIYFFGGEPTLEFEKMKELTEFFKEGLKEYELHFAMYTNGLRMDLIPQSVLSALSLVKFSVNYEHIPKHGLKDSYFSKIIDNVIAVKSRNPKIQVMARLTVTEKTSLYTEVLQVHPFFDSVYWQIENCRECEDYTSFYSTYTYESALLFRFWLEYFKKGIMLQFVPFMSILKFMFFHDRDDTVFCCGYGSHMIYIQTEGSCYACSDSVTEGIHKMGTIQDGVVLTGSSLVGLVCENCQFRAVCMGRCGRMHKEFSKERVEQYCALNQYVFGLFYEQREEFKVLFSQYPEYEKRLCGWVIDSTELTS